MNNYTHNITDTILDQQQAITQQSQAQSLMNLMYALGLGGGIVSIIYWVLNTMREELKKHLVASITLESGDILYKWVQAFLIEKKYLKNLSNLSVNSQQLQDTKQRWWKKNDEDVKKTQILYEPDNGIHKFTYRGKSVFIQQTQGQTITVGQERKPQKQVTMKLWMLGKYNITTLQKLIYDSFEHALDKDCGKTKIYAMHDWYADWEQVQSKEPRTFESVILDQNFSEELLQDISSFLTNKQWYTDRGVPYRRGYLLYGPPGTGKTSTILALASKLQLNLCTVNLSGNRLDDDSFNKLLESTPKGSIVLLEDIDAVFVDRVSAKKAEGRTVSFSGLLNAIDGVRSTDGRILFMTTNHKEKLDPALLRAGRADVHIKLDFASYNQIEKLFLKFFPGENKKAQEFTKLVPEKVYSMAKLQGHFVKYKNNQDLLIKRLDELKENKQVKQDMHILDWLNRFGLQEFTHKFIKEDLYRIKDLKNFNDGQLKEFGIETIGQKQNVMGVMKGEKQFINQFLLMPHNTLRMFLINFLQLQGNDKIIEEILEVIPENSVSQFQLQSIFGIANQQAVLEEKDELLKQLKELVEHNDKLENDKEYRNTFLVEKKKEEKKEETDDELELEIDIKSFLKDLELEQYLEQFQTQKISGEMLLKMKAQDLQSLQITTYGHRLILQKAIEELNKVAEKERERIKELKLKNKNKKDFKKYFITQEEEDTNEIEEKTNTTKDNTSQSE